MMTVMGVQPFAFSDGAGKMTDGNLYYLSYPLVFGDGCGCETVFVPDSVFSFSPRVGDLVDLNALSM